MINWLSFGLSFFDFFLFGILQPRYRHIRTLAFCIVFVYTLLSWDCLTLAGNSSPRILKSDARIEATSRQ
jgi:hypothetical protein